MCLSKQENVDAILVGLEKTACLIDRCAIYESLCTDDSAASRNLEKSILRLYTAILKFLANAIRVLNGELEYSLNHHGRTYSMTVPQLILSQITSSRQYLGRFPTTSLKSSSWRKRLDGMLPLLRPNVLSC